MDKRLSDALIGLAAADVIIKRLKTERDDLLAACEAAIHYDEAVQSCANDPDKMASYCTAQGKDLDVLYSDWLNKVRVAIARARGA